MRIRLERPKRNQRPIRVELRINTTEEAKAIRQELRVVQFADGPAQAFFVELERMLDRALNDGGNGTVLQSMLQYGADDDGDD